MKRKMIPTLLMAAVLLLMAFSTVRAAPVWYLCTVDNAGTFTAAASAGKAYIQLTDTNGAFSQKWFVAPQAVAREALAVAMTAQTTKGKVQLFSDLSVAGTFTPIMGLFNKGN